MAFALVGQGVGLHDQVPAALSPGRPQRQVDGGRAGVRSVGVEQRRGAKAGPQRGVARREHCVARQPDAVGPAVTSLFFADILDHPRQRHVLAELGVGAGAGDALDHQVGAHHVQQGARRDVVGLEDVLVNTAGAVGQGVQVIIPAQSGGDGDRRAAIVACADGQNAVVVEAAQLNVVAVADGGVRTEDDLVVPPVRRRGREGVGRVGDGPLDLDLIAHCRAGRCPWPGGRQIAVHAGQHLDLVGVHGLVGIGVGQLKDSVGAVGDHEDVVLARGARRQQAGPGGVVAGIDRQRPRVRHLGDLDVAGAQHVVATEEYLVGPLAHPPGRGALVGHGPIHRQRRVWPHHQQVRDGH